MMMHHDISLTQPFGSTGSERHSTVVNTDKPPVARRMHRECDFFGEIEAGFGWTVCQDDKLVRLSNCLSRPIGGPLVGQINDQVVLALERIQPIYDSYVVKFEIRKALFQICACEKTTFSQACKGHSEAMKEFGRNAAVSSGNDGYGARRRDPGATCYTGGGVGKPLCEAR